MLGNADRFDRSAFSPRFVGAARAVPPRRSAFGGAPPHAGTPSGAVSFVTVRRSQDEGAESSLLGRRNARPGLAAVALDAVHVRLARPGALVESGVAPMGEALSVARARESHRRGLGHLPRR